MRIFVHYIKIEGKVHLSLTSFETLFLT